MDVDIQVADETAPDYDISDNSAENLVDVIRSDMVGNEEQFLLLNFMYATGLFEDPKCYVAARVEGSSGDGKSELKGNVDANWPNHWLLKVTQTSDKGLIDDDRWNERYIFAGDEVNKLEKTTLEFLKSCYGDDADEDGYGFNYVRNVEKDDGDRGSKEIKKQSLPFVVLWADENSVNSDWELDTRVMEINVESDAELNEAVGATQWDHTSVEVEDRAHEYNFPFGEGKKAVQRHIAQIPRPVEGHNQNYARPVHIPNSEEKFGWNAFKVVRSMFQWGKSDSKRASKTVASLVRASALFNYHNRRIIEINGEEHYLAEAQDLANVAFACRRTLLSLTHDLNDKKFAVIEALTDEHNGVGGPGPHGGLAAPVKDIAEYIDNYADITTMSESQLRSILEEMADRFLLTIHEGEGENGAHLYEFHGGSTFGHPNLDEYPDLWDGVTDPIRDQPIRETVEEMKDELHTVSSDELMDSDPNTVLGKTVEEDDESDDETAADDLSAFGGGTEEEEDVELSEVEQRVADCLEATLDDLRVEAQYLDKASDAYISTEHMVGASPVEKYTDDRGMPYVKAKRPTKDGDTEGTVLDADDPLWGDTTEGKVRSRVENAIASLRSKGVFEIHDEPDSDDKYLVVHQDS